MANFSTLFINDVDLREYGVTLIDYDEPVLASPKDGGGIDFEEIDGLINSSLSSYTAPTGSFEIIIERENIADVYSEIRNLKNNIITGNFVKFSTLENIGFYRLGKVVGAKAVSIVDTPYRSYASGTYKFEIQYQDGYEYSSNIVESIHIASKLKTVEEVESYNPGTSSRSFKIKISASKNIVGIIQINLYTVENNVFRFKTSIRIGDAEYVTLKGGDELIIDFNTPAIQTVSKGKVVNSLSLFKSGTFFEIPHGKFKLGYYLVENEANGFLKTVEYDATFIVNTKYR